MTGTIMDYDRNQTEKEEYQKLGQLWAGALQIGRNSAGRRDLQQDAATASVICYGGFSPHIRHEELYRY